MFLMQAQGTKQLYRVAEQNSNVSKLLSLRCLVLRDWCPIVCKPIYSSLRH